MKTNDSEQKNEVKRQQQAKGCKHESAKEKSSTGLWIFGSIAFLFLIFGISMYASSRSNDQADLQTRSVTLTDAGFDTPITFQAETTEDDYMRYLNIVKDVFVNDNKLLISIIPMKASIM